MIFFVMAQWLRLGVLERRRSHRKMFRVVTFMSPSAFYITIQTWLHLYRQKLLKFEGFDVMWQETPRVEIKPGRKSWDRAEMAQTGQNYHYFPKRAENQNDQNLMVVWWYRILLVLDLSWSNPFARNEGRSSKTEEKMRFFLCRTYLCVKASVCKSVCVSKRLCVKASVCKSFCV